MANKIIIFIYPIFEFLLLVAMVLLGYSFYQVGQNTKLMVTALFSLYVLWRLITRTKSLFDKLQENEDSPQEDTSTGNKLND